MLVGFLKHNRSLAVLALPILTIIIWAYGFIYPAAPAAEHPAVLYKLIITNIESYPPLTTSLSILFILSEALLINFIFRKNEIAHTTSPLPGVVYMVLMSLQPEMYFLHPIIIANLFMLLAIHILLQTYRKETSFSMTFNTGFFIGMATLFYIPSVVFFLFLWSGLLILKPFIWRDWIISIMGILLPWWFVLFYYFWTDSLSVLQNDILFYTLVYTDKSLSEWHVSVPEGIQLAVLLFSVFAAFSHQFLYGSGKSSIRTRSNNQLLIAFIILSVISMLFAPHYSISHLSFTAIPFTAFLSNYLLNTKKQWMAEVLLLLLIISIFLNQYIL